MSLFRRSLKALLILSTVIFFTACGGGGGTTPTAEQQALDTIVNYVNNGGEAPKLSDYQTLHIDGVTEENLAAVNQLIADLDIVAVDDIQGAVDALEVFRAYAASDGNNGHPPTQADYAALGITGVTDANRDAINDLISGKIAEQTDSQGEIQGIVDEHAGMKRIFILGSSTVHAGDYISGDFGDPYGSDRKLEGWGEQLKYYMKAPKKVYNRARSGADSITYRVPDPDRENLPGYKDRDWGHTEILIKDTNDSNGGFLFIQFGANDSHHNIGTDVFQDQLKAYIADAKRLGLTPVLLSPPNSRNHYNSRPYAEYVEPVATEEDVLFLDLHQKSMSVWATYEINEDYDGDGVEDNPLFQTLPEADILYGYLEYHRGINNTHFSPIGANIVAGWIKELACESDREDARLLCSQFLEKKLAQNKVDPVIAVKGKAEVNIDINAPYVDKGATASDDIDGDISGDIEKIGAVDVHTLGTYILTYQISDSSGNEASTTRKVNVVDLSAGIATMREDAEDGNASRWTAYAGGGTVSNIADHDGRVIEFTGQNGIDNAYMYDIQNGSQGYVVSWDMKFNEAFKFMVKVQTVENGYVYITYVPEAIDEGNRTEDSRKYVYLALGTDANDGTWKTFTRDIVADLHKAYQDFEITSIVGFRVRGNGSIDNIQTITRESSAVFSYGGHSYEIVKSMKSWQEASDDAVAKGGYLARVDSKAENEEIYSRLYHHISTADELAESRARDGGNATYVWLGGSDTATEASWRWINDHSEFSQGNTPTVGMFTNWGQAWDAAESQEPDDWHGEAAGAPDGQDFLAIAIDNPINPGSDMGNHRQWPWGLAGQWNDVAAAEGLYYIIEYGN